MLNGTKRLIVFTRYPIPGKTKTRLIPGLGPEGAMELHRRLTVRTVRTAETLCSQSGVELEIRFAGGNEFAMSHWLGDGKLFRPQGAGDLGAGMLRAFEESFREGSSRTVIIGSDCPGLNCGLLARAFDALSTHQAVLGPARDGGYYLIGLSRVVPDLFHGIQWGSHTVFNETLRLLSGLNIEPALLETLDDIDRPEDIPLWRRIIEPEEADLHKVSVIIPALNEAKCIAKTIAAARSGNPEQIIVVDGGSSDSTPQLAHGEGAKVLASAPGRARQMNAGATGATGNALLFLHADTIVPGDYLTVLQEKLRDSSTAAGAFAFAINSRFTGSRFVEAMTNLRSRWLQLPYGDQGLFLRRSLFERLGGFADLPIMEDYEFVWRLRRYGRVITAKQKVLTSGRRWERHGILRVTLINQLLLAGYHAGVPIHRLRKLYG